MPQSGGQSVVVTHNEAENRFEAPLRGGLAMLEYRRSGNSITFFHTEVPAQHQGRGIAAQLVHEGLRYARESGLKVIPQCAYVAAYLRRHPGEAA